MVGTYYMNNNASKLSVPVYFSILTNWREKMIIAKKEKKKITNNFQHC